MPRSVITTLVQRVEIEDVLDVVHTEITQFPEDGPWVREIRVMGTPEDGETGSVQVFVLRLKSPTKNNLNLTTTPLEI